MPRLSDSLVCIDIEDRLLVHVPETRTIVLLNSSAKRVTEFCDGVTPFSKVVRELASEWETNLDEVEPDLREVIRNFIKKKIAKYDG
jgi:hypothetical protein